MIEISRYDIHTLQAVFGWGSCIWDREIGRSEGQTHVSQIGTEEGENRRSMIVLTLSAGEGAAKW